HKVAVLEEGVAWLREHGYVVAQAECGSCESKEDVLRSVSEALGFPKGPFPNLDSFNDDCRDIEVPEDGGFALVLLHSDQVVSRLAALFERVLDILATASRDQLLFGRRLICLVQSDDPRLHLAPVGGLSPFWNPREWFDKDRGL